MCHHAHSLLLTNIQFNRKDSDRLCPLFDVVHTVKFYCVQHSGLQKLSRPGVGGSNTKSRGVARDISDYSKSSGAPASFTGPAAIRSG